MTNQALPASKTRRGALLIGLAALFALLSIGLIIAVLRTPLADMLGGRVATSIVPPETREAAITPFTPPASTGEYAALSGRGEGLDCSIDGFIEKLAFSRQSGGVSVNLRYRQACVAHDYCYRHGATTYGYTQADCDAALARAALRVCRSHPDPEGECLTQVRKVYAGLAVGGAGSFRPKRPDLLASGEGQAATEAVGKACTEAKAVNRDPPELRFAYPEWPKALKARFALGWFDAAANRAYRLALGRCYGDLSPTGVTALLTAWLDVASTAGEYDPFPLGTADVSLPRLVRLDGRTASLVFYKQRAGGAEIGGFGWMPGSRSGILLPCQGGSACRGFVFSQRVPQTYEFRPGTPWVTRLADNREGLLWWRRKLSGIDSTAGNLQLLSLDPKKTTLADRMDGSFDPCGANLYPVPTAPGRIAAIGIAPNNCDADQYKLPLFRTPIFRFRDVGPTAKRLRGWWGRAELPVAGDQTSWLAIPPLAERSILTEGRGTAARHTPGFRLSLFRRSPSDFRAVAESRTWFVPGDFKTRKGWHLTAPRYEKALYDAPDAQEPYVALRGSDGYLRLLGIACEPGGSPSERCSPTRDGTRITLWSARGRPMSAPLPLPASFARARAVVIRRSDYRHLDSGSGYTLLLTRFSARSVDSNFVLDAFVDRVDVDDGRITDRGEIELGSMFAGRDFEEGLQKASRLFPLVGDIDGDGTPDLVLADPTKGAQSRAISNILGRSSKTPQGVNGYSNNR